MYDSSGYSESIHQMLLHKIDKDGRLYFSERDGFGPFAEVIGGSKYESVTFAGRWGDGPDDIDLPHIERPIGDGQV